jgi:hypothetical protein
MPDHDIGLEILEVIQEMKARMTDGKVLCTNHLKEPATPQEIRSKLIYRTLTEKLRQPFVRKVIFGSVALAKSAAGEPKAVRLISHQTYGYSWEIANEKPKNEKNYPVHFTFYFFLDCLYFFWLCPPEGS